MVALEANPRFCDAARKAHALDSADDRFQIVDKALWNENDALVRFFVRDLADGWSSLYQHVAERDGEPSRAIAVATATLSLLIDRYGVPYYIKCDIKGGNRIFAEQLIAERRRPPFVSIEIDSLDLPQRLRQAG